VYLSTPPRVASAFRATRIFVWETLRDTVLAPFSGAVLFHHFFIADFVTSLVRALQDLAYSFCFYFTGDFMAAAVSTPARCETSLTYIVFAYVLALLPYYWRLMQCVRRYRDDPARQGAQLWNAAKVTTELER
jgi:hypothetical protein